MGEPLAAGETIDGGGSPLAAGETIDAAPAGHPLTDTPPDAVSRFGSSFASGAGVMSNEQGKNFFAHPLDTLTAMAQTQGELGARAAKELKNKDYVRGLTHAAEYMLPAIGPALAHSGDQLESGDIAGGAGTMLGVGGNLLLGAKMAPSSSVAELGKPGTPVSPTDMTAGRVLRTGGKQAVRMVNDIPGVRALSKLKADYESTAPKPPAPAKPIITDPAEIQTQLQKILSSNRTTPGQAASTPGSVTPKSVGPSAPPVPETSTTVPEKGTPNTNGRAAPKTNAAPATAGTAEGAANDTKLFQQAKASLSEDASISDVAKAAQKLKDGNGAAENFEKIFGRPLADYTGGGKGSFRMKDFLNEVVKPGQQPPAQVITKVFGADGVKAIEELTGKPIATWEAGEGTSKAARAATKTPATTVQDSLDGKLSDGEAVKKYGPVSGELTDEVPARGFLKKVGTNEESLAETDAQIGKDTHSTVQYHRGQLRKGMSEPATLRVDANNEVLDADGRHRAVAAIQEHGPTAKIKVRLIQHTGQ